MFKKGAKLNLKTHFDKNTAVTVNETFIHHTFKAEVKTSFNSEFAGLWSYDVAVIKVNEKIRDIEIAELNFDPVTPNLDVLIGGYGCEVSIGDAFDYKKSRYKIAISAVTQKADEKVGEEFKHAPEVNTYNYFSLPTGPEKAALCPGDSGGPVYLVGTGEIIGVNSLAYNNKDQIHYLNGHTRISELKNWFAKVLK